MVSDYIVSHIRTYVPILVGAAITWAIAQLHERYGILVVVDTPQVAVVVTGLATAAYYALVRALERRWPGAGRLLGVAVQPSYSPPG